jgi:segregation and condensation protein B
MTEKENINDFDETESPWRPEEAAIDESEPMEQAEPEPELESELSPQEPELVDEPEAIESIEPEDTDQESPEDNQDTSESETPILEETETSEEPEISTIAVIEAILFATNEPITPNKIVDIVGAGDVKQVRKQIEELNQKYEQMNCSFRIEGIAGGYQMLTLSQYNPWLSKLLRVRAETKLSPAALETLAIISYKQPIMRVDVEAIRGVAAGEMIRQLIDKGLVKIVGRAEELGRPLLYGTTKKFLQVFGLNSLKDLPTAEDLKKPD